MSLDVASFEKSDHKDKFEHTLEVVASLAVQLDRKGYAVGFAANGRLKGGRSAVVPLGRGPHQIPAILETLARIQAAPIGKMTRIIRQLVAAQQRISCVHFCYADDLLPAEMTHFFRQQQIPVSFFVCHRDSKIPHAGMTNLYTINEIRVDRRLRREPGQT